MRYLQCPLCNSSLWTTEAYVNFTCKQSCESCGRFSYSDRSEWQPLLNGNLSLTIHKEVEWALIENYLITVNYINDTTLIETYHKWDSVPTKEVVLLRKAVQFDWYNKQSVMDKLKKYLVFL